ncbi:MAG: hypothetical protein WD512_20865, partial [Candidatus Paceibacterota bacterium]
IGYTKENVIPVCYICNKIKSSYPFSLQEMHIIGKAVRTMQTRSELNNNINDNKEKYSNDFIVNELLK